MQGEQLEELAALQAEFLETWPVNLGVPWRAVEARLLTVVNDVKG